MTTLEEVEKEAERLREIERQKEAERQREANRLREGREKEVDEEGEDAQRMMLRLLKLSWRNQSSGSCQSHISTQSPGDQLSLVMAAEKRLPYEKPKSLGPVRSFARAAAQQSMVARVEDARMIQTEEGWVAIFCQWLGLPSWMSKEALGLSPEKARELEIAKIAFESWVRTAFSRAWSDERSEIHKKFKLEFGKAFKIPDVDKVLALLRRSGYRVFHS